MRKYYILALAGLTFLLMEKTIGQDLTLGFTYSYAESRYQKKENSAIIERDQFSRLGFPVSYSPFLSSFSVNSGLEFEFREFGNYLTMPLLLRIKLGQTFRVYGEGGLYYSFMLKKSTIDYIVKNDWGVRVGFGIIYTINQRWRAELGYNFNYGIAESIIKEQQLPYDQIKKIGHDMRASYISIGGFYRF